MSVGGSGGDGGGIYGSSAKAMQVRQVVLESIAQRNVQVALDKYGATLNKLEREALLNLNPEELSALQSVNAKLAPLGIDAMY